MQHITSKYWWTFFIRGCLGVFFGLFILFLWPIFELGRPMIIFFGIFIFIQGVLILIAYMNIRKSHLSLPLLLESVLGIAIGTFLLLRTDFTLSAFIVSFVIWGIGIGICKVVRAAYFYKEHEFFVGLGINGLLSILFCIMIYIQTEVTNKPTAWTFSIYLVVYGSLLIIFGLKLKSIK